MSTKYGNYPSRHHVCFTPEGPDGAEAVKPATLASSLSDMRLTRGLRMSA